MKMHLVNVLISKKRYFRNLLKKLKMVLLHIAGYTMWFLEEL